MITKGIVFRKAKVTDTASITETFIVSRTQAMPFLPVLHTTEETADWIENIILKERDVWVAEKCGKCIGFIAVGHEEIDQLYIHPEHQGHGIGKALLQFAKSRFNRLSLYAFQKNLGARRFYEREGFKTVSLNDGSRNEEKEPDVLFEWNVSSK